MSLLSPLRPSISACFIALASMSLLGFTSCEKVGGIGAKLEEALNRKPTSTESGVPQPDPEQLLADEPDTVIPPPPEPVKMEPEINKDARVSILGYHDFTEGKSRNDMIINIDDFRAEMQAIKDAEIPVISMREFLAWKRGEEEIPDPCIMITIDDGWKATHTLAMPVLKEFGYPFTIFLYKKYVGIGGRSLTFDEVKELMANGANVGSHSVSHQNMARNAGRNATQQTAWLKDELEESWKFLNENFGSHGEVLKTFAYPFGIYSDEVIDLADKFGYEACFTVNGKKTTWEDHHAKLGRYVVHGKTLANFDLALDFGGGGTTTSGRSLMTESTTEDGEVRGPLVTTWPAEGQTIIDRLPEIQMNVAGLEGFDPESVVMRVTGLGKVTHHWDADTSTVRFQIPQRLRSDTCGVKVSFKHAGKKDWEVIAWNFHIDRLAGYLPPDALDKLREHREESDETPGDENTAKAASLPVANELPKTAAR
ncbi:MAG: polysaccharide deacetylase family protein [Verrucomicrobiae bacterium]|nr:polysaccharide deacetylase family protein [Verrucomicrobiae bacterium]